MAHKYVLLTNRERYFVEFLIGELVLSESITHAMEFDDIEIAIKFKKMLHNTCDIICSVNTYIPS